MGISRKMQWSLGFIAVGLLVLGPMDKGYSEPASSAPDANIQELLSCSAAPQPEFKDVWLVEIDGKVIDSHGFVEFLAIAIRDEMRLITLLRKGETSDYVGLLQFFAQGTPESVKISLLRQLLDIPGIRLECPVINKKADPEGINSLSPAAAMESEISTPAITLQEERPGIFSETGGIGVMACPIVIGSTCDIMDLELILGGDTYLLNLDGSSGTMPGAGGATP